MNTVLITGANRGIGFELATQYAEAGWNVIACYRTPEKMTALQKLKDSNTNAVSLYQLEVTEKKSITELSKKLLSEKIDLLINNAGIFTERKSDGSWARLDDIKAEALRHNFEVNTIAPLLLVQALLPTLMNGELKTIVNISSTLGSISANTDGGIYPYRASKAALNAITKNLAIDLKPKGFTVVSIHPGWVKTDMGGQEAKIEISDSVDGIRKVIAGLTQNNTGSFFDYLGNKQDW